MILIVQLNDEIKILYVGSQYFKITNHLKIFCFRNPGYLVYEEMSVVKINLSFLKVCETLKFPPKK